MPDQVQNQVNQDVQRSLGRIEGKVDGICEDIKEIKDNIMQINGRVRKNEQELSLIKGKAAAIGGGAGVLIAIIWEYIKQNMP